MNMKKCWRAVIGKVSKYNEYAQLIMCGIMMILSCSKRRFNWMNYCSANWEFGETFSKYGTLRGMPNVSLHWVIICWGNEWMSLTWSTEIETLFKSPKCLSISRACSAKTCFRKKVLTFSFSCIHEMFISTGSNSDWNLNISCLVRPQCCSINLLFFALTAVTLFWQSTACFQLDKQS